MSAAKDRLKGLLPKGAFGRSVAILAGGTALGQAIAILASPILTRLYGPADFGVLAVYTAVIGIVGALAALSYHQAIPLPESDDEAAGAFGVSILSTLLIAGLTAIAVAIGGTRLAKALGSPGLEPYMWMIPLGVLGLASYEVLTQWAVRKKAFSTIARTSVAKGVAQTGTQLGLGFAAFGPFGLLLGQLIGQWTGSGSLLRRALKESGPAIRGVTPAGLRAAASRYKRFPLFTTPAALLNTASINAPPILLAYFYGGEVTGLYALGQRVLMMPVTLVAKSASQVFLASAPEAHRQGLLGVETEKNYSRMLQLGLGPMLVVGVAAPEIFAVVFGSGWRQAGIYAQWLVPWLFFLFVGMPFTSLVSVLERQAAGMVFYAVLLVGRVGALVAGGMIGDADIAVALFAAAGAVCWLGYLLWLLSIGGMRVGKMVIVFGKEIARSAPCIAPVVLARLFISNETAITGTAVLSGVLVILRIVMATRK